MKTVILLIAAIAAFLFFKPSSDRTESSKAVEPVKAAPRTGIVVAAATGGQRATGLKTGPNAQTDLNPSISLFKTGPNAQTDLTLKRSW